MKKDRQYVLVCYDIVDDGKRVKVQHVADAYGERINDSVYECWLDAKREAMMKRRIEALIDPKEDVVYIYRLCAPCVQKITVFGLRAETRPPRLMIITDGEVIREY